MISEQEARTRILEKITPLPEQAIALANASGCFSARDLVARLPLPMFDNSAMDGYAVAANSCTKGARLRVIGEQPAGPDRDLHVHPGEAIRIFTGAPLPKGADAIVMQEDVTREGSEITVNAGVEAGDFVRRRGCDLTDGQIMLEKGKRIRVGTVALLASQGLAEVFVGGKPHAAVISTGDELVQPGGKIGLGQIYDSNSALLDALLLQCGASVNSVEHCRDDHESLRDAIKRGIERDVLIISGGVSVGEHDLVKETLKQLGAEIEIWQVAIKPGKPFLFARVSAKSSSAGETPADHTGRMPVLHECLVFGLPGNPVSAFVTFLQFVRPVLLKLMGATDLDLPRLPANLRIGLTNHGDRPHYVRGRLEQGEFTPIGRQESHALFGLSLANALLRVGVGESLKSGEIVEVQIWDC